MPNLFDFSGHDSSELLRTRLSGRYIYNDGAGARAEMSAAEAESVPCEAALKNPIYNIEQPIYTPNPGSRDSLHRIRFTLHIDIDGTDPLQVRHQARLFRPAERLQVVCPTEPGRAQ